MSCAVFKYQGRLLIKIVLVHKTFNKLVKLNSEKKQTEPLGFYTTKTKRLLWSLEHVPLKRNLPTWERYQSTIGITSNITVHKNYLSSKSI